MSHFHCSIFRSPCPLTIKHEATEFSNFETSAREFEFVYFRNNLIEVTDYQFPCISHHLSTLAKARKAAFHFTLDQCFVRFPVHTLETKVERIQVEKFKILGGIVLFRGQRWDHLCQRTAISAPAGMSTFRSSMLQLGRHFVQLIENRSKFQTIMSITLIIS